MWLIFGMDIDDCLATEFFLSATEGGYNVEFSGDIYDDIKEKIVNTQTVHPDAKIIISSYSTRQSLFLDRCNSQMNSTISSSHLLYSLARQLAEELASDIYLDQTWLADLITGESSFIVSLKTPKVLVAVDNAKPCVVPVLLEQAIKSGYFTALECKQQNIQGEQRHLKLARARQIIDNAQQYFQLAPDAKIELFLYDDGHKYLTVIDELFAMEAPRVNVSLLLTDSYYQFPDGIEHQLDRNVITTLKTIDATKNYLVKMIQPWLGKLNKPRPDSYTVISRTTKPIVIPCDVIRQLEETTQRMLKQAELWQHEGRKNVYMPGGQPISKQKTLLAHQAEQGYSWGKGGYPTYPMKGQRK